MDEDLIILAAQQGDLESFNRLVLDYQDQVYTHAYRFLGDGDAAADAAQNAFIKAYQYIRSFKPGSFKAWLLRIVSNECYDELRRQKRRPTQPLEALDPRTDEEIEDAKWMVDEGNLPEDALNQKELQSVIQCCIQDLPPEFRAIVLLVDVNGLDYKQAAQAARVPIGTVRSRLARARLRLQECLCSTGELLPDSIRYTREGRI